MNKVKDLEVKSGLEVEDTSGDKESEPERTTTGTLASEKLSL